MSVKTRVESLVSGERRAATKHPVTEHPVIFDPDPLVKTSVGMSYSALSDTLLSSLAEAQSQMKGFRFSKLVDALYLSPRLVHWHPVEGGFRLWSINDSAFVTVMADKIYLTKGIRVWAVAHGLTASTLHDSIAKAQVILTSVAPASPMSEDEQAEYFSPDPQATFEDIDAALMERDQNGALDQFFDPELVESAVQRKVGGDLHTSRTNRKAASDALQTKQEYKDKDPVAECPRMDSSLVVARMKSLQGRILNIMEASLADKTQREAVKILINKEFRHEMSRVVATVVAEDED